MTLVTVETALKSMLKEIHNVLSPSRQLFIPIITRVRYTMTLKLSGYQTRFRVTAKVSFLFFRLIRGEMDPTFELEWKASSLGEEE